MGGGSSTHETRTDDGRSVPREVEAASAAHAPRIAVGPAHDPLAPLLPLAAAAYRERVRQFNRMRARLAGQALARLRPQPHDFAACAHAPARYACALELFHADRYVRQLERVIAGAAQNVVPVFDDGHGGTCDPTALAPLPLRRVLAALGLPLAAHAEATHLVACHFVLATVPDALLIEFASPLAPRALRGEGAGAAVHATAAPVAAFAGDGDSHPPRRLALRLHAEPLSLPPLAARRDYRWAAHLAQLPPDARRLLARSPELCAVLDGQPVAWPRRAAGFALDYEAVIADPAAHAPLSPLEPLRLREGEALLLHADGLAAAGLDALHRALPQATPAAAFGVLRLDGARVAVFAGHVAAVERAALFGAAVGDGELRSATLDLATADGRRGYRRFLACGAVPHAADAAPAPRNAPAQAMRRLH